MEITSSVINALIIYGICQAFFIAIIVLRSKNKTLFKKLFAALLIVEGIILFERLLVETELINSAPHLLGIAYPISFLKPPLLLFMAFSITQKDFRISKRIWWHSIPFILILLMNLPFFFLSGADKLSTVKSFMEEVPSYSNFSFYFTLSFFAYIGIYVYLGLRNLNRYRQQVTNNNLANWYRVILIAYTAFLSLHLLYFLVQPIGQLNLAHMNQLSMLAMTFIIQAIAFRVMDQSTLFKMKTPISGDPEQRKSDFKQILKKLEYDKIYLNEDLTLEAFAKEVELPQDYVSELINQKTGYSFKKLIKKYRLAEAKKIMENSDGHKLKLIDIAYQSGFSNKVSFYRAFKELEKTSPSEYLLKLRK